MAYYQISNQMIHSKQIEDVIPIQEVKKNGDDLLQFAIILKNKEILIYSRLIEETEKLLIRLEMEELYLNIEKTIKKNESEVAAVKSEKKMILFS